MSKQFLKVLCSFLAISSVSSLFARSSITSEYTGYRDICEQVATDPEMLNSFRTFSAYRCVLEIDDGDTFAKYIQSRWAALGSHIEEFRKVDQIGNPPLKDYPGLGSFSATTLRYIFHADQILKHLKLPAGAKLAEIGAGFGGQAYVLQCLHPCSAYYVYDLPEVEMLIGKMMEVLDVQTVHCVPMDDPLPEERIDLVISNYAFSECDRETQMSYFERVIKKADRGYLIYNQIAITDHNMDSIPYTEFIDLLKQNGIKPKVYKEFFQGAGNFLIFWDKTK